MAKSVNAQIDSSLHSEGQTIVVIEGENLRTIRFKSFRESSANSPQLMLKKRLSFRTQRSEERNLSKIL